MYYVANSYLLLLLQFIIECYAMIVLILSIILNKAVTRVLCKKALSVRDSVQKWRATLESESRLNYTLEVILGIYPDSSLIPHQRSLVL